MLEPTWNPIAMPTARLTGGRHRARIVRRPTEAEAPNKEWLVCAAPFSFAALWIAATGASVLFWSITGRREPLDWCRSGGVLTVAAALSALSALLASALNGVEEGPSRFSSRKPAPAPLYPAAPGPGWWDPAERVATDF